MTTRSLVLFAHGARDPRWAGPFQRLQEIVQQQKPEVAVHLAFLELMTPRLPELTAELVAKGCKEITVVPIFFGQGGHVLRDLPIILEQLKGQYPGLVIGAVPAVGEDAEVLQAIARYCVGAL